MYLHPFYREIPADATSFRLAQLDKWSGKWGNFEKNWRKG